MLNLTIEKRRNLILTTNGILLVMTAGFALFKYMSLNTGAIPYPAVVVCLLIAANSIYLILGGDQGNSEILMMLILGGGLLATTINTGGYDGAPVILAPILPMVATLWFGAATGWRILGLLVVMLSAVLWMDLGTLLPANPLSPENLAISRYLGTTLTAVVCTWITWAFSESKQVDIHHNQQQASTDHLTGLANRRALDAAVLREVGRARRDQSSLSLIMIDVDHFKRYNDSNGHQAGDKCLTKVAKVIATVAQRPADVASRFGGEEFAVLLPDTDAKGAYHVAESIRKQMLELELVYEKNSSDFVSLTLGVITIKGTRIKSIKDLIKEADAALYRGKSNGRNQVVIKSIGGSISQGLRYA